MADELRVERQDGLRLAALPDKPDKVALVGRNADGMGISAADLLWLVTTGGPAMIALLGGPLAIKGGTAPGEVGQRG